MASPQISHDQNEFTKLNKQITNDFRNIYVMLKKS